MVSYHFVILIGWCFGSICGYTTQDAPLLQKRPSWLLPCQKSASNLSSCINTMFLNMFPNLAAGIPEINVEHFEPLLLDSVSVSKGNGAISIVGKFYDLNIIGPSNSTPQHSEFMEKNKRGHWNFVLDIPKLIINAKYNMKGKILVLPLVGHGNCQLKLNHIHTKIYSNITFPVKEGKEIMHIENLKVKFKVGSIWVQFDNLFNGNQILGNAVNAYVNQNGIEIVAELEESIADSLAVIFTQLMNNVFSKIPTDLWYLDDAAYEEYQNELKSSSEIS